MRNWDRPTCQTIWQDFRNNWLAHLDELAAMMADVPELTAVIDRVSGSTASSPADDYLPSKQLIDELRTLAKESSSTAGAAQPICPRRC